MHGSGQDTACARPGVILCVCEASTGRGERWSPQDLDSLIAVTMLWGSVT